MKSQVDQYLKKTLDNAKFPRQVSWKPQDVPKELTNSQLARKRKRESKAAHVIPGWLFFWDVILDRRYEFCFVCGYYIQPMFRDDFPKHQRPFKNGDVCHAECYNKSITIDDVKKRIDADSLLICHIDKGDTLEKNPVCRNRVRNNPRDILIHYMTHQNEVIPAFTKPEQVDQYWTGVMQVFWIDFRNSNFLKPTGQPFRIPPL